MGGTRVIILQNHGIFTVQTLQDRKSIFIEERKNERRKKIKESFFPIPKRTPTNAVTQSNTTTLYPATSTAAPLTASTSPSIFSFNTLQSSYPPTHINQHPSPHPAPRKQARKLTLRSFTTFPLFILSPRFLSSLSITASAFPTAFSMRSFWRRLASFPPRFRFLIPLSPSVARSMASPTFLAVASLLLSAGSSEARGSVASDLSSPREGEA